MQLQGLLGTKGESVVVSSLMTRPMQRFFSGNVSFGQIYPNVRPVCIVC